MRFPENGVTANHSIYFAKLLAVTFRVARQRFTSRRAPATINGNFAWREKHNAARAEYDRSAALV
jgi:hypothetical protein